MKKFQVKLLDAGFLKYEAMAADNRYRRSHRSPRHADARAYLS